MTEPVLLTEIDDRGVAYVTLNRPEVHNAYNGALIDAMVEGLDALATRGDIRALVVRSRAKHFQAGADVNFLREMSGAPFERNLAFSRQTTLAMKKLNEFPALTVALVNGACYGGGCGIVAVADIAIASHDAAFGLTEVRLGAVPSPIAHYLNSSMGTRWVRRYGCTGERFDADTARLMGLVHEVVPRAELDAAGERAVAEILKNAPEAVRKTKHLTLETAGLLLDDAEVNRLALIGAEARASEEAQHGFAAHLGKRPPRWAP